METVNGVVNIHGVDVSWLHHANRDNPHRNLAPSSPGLSRDPPPPHSHRGVKPASTPAPEPPQSDYLNAKPVPQSSEQQVPSTPPVPTPAPAQNPMPTPATPAPATPTVQKVGLKRPSLLSRQSADKNAAASPGDAGGKRRNSWISSISSKFGSQSSSPQQAPPSPNVPSHNKAQSRAQPNGAHTAAPTLDHSNSNNGSLVGPKGGAKEATEQLEPYVPQQPQKGTGFLTNAFRRLSSNSQSGTNSKVVPNGGVCPRRTLNIDPNRERCPLPDVDQSKLKRVAFCVDVEIAGGPRYKDDDDSGEKKKKSKKLKEKGEGEALKHPEALIHDKEETGVVGGENVGKDPPTEATSAPAEPPETPSKTDEPDTNGDATKDGGTSRKKEKKKRSEEERKERKEKKRRKAEENGCIPMEFTQDVSEANTKLSTTPPEAQSVPRPQDRPTIDPVRIYRRCCQLRETPILKRITEQLMASSDATMQNNGVVTSLDLTGSRLTLSDVETLADWLAIVPVKRLLLENAELTDEGVRVILCALLAAQSPQPTKRRSSSPNKANSIKSDRKQERSGIVEKLVLKNNPRLTKEAWKYIAIFTYLCRSIKALDLSMIPFPGDSDTAPGHMRHSSHGTKPHPGPADIFCKALAERLAGKHLEELSVSECSLAAEDIRKITDAASMAGIARLGLAGNNITLEGFAHVLRYLRSGQCQALDIGGVDMTDKCELLADSLTEHTSIWGLCLADCNLTPTSLKILLPALIKVPDFRFLDLSHNHGLFSADHCTSALRKFLPHFENLRRLHLIDVSMSPAQAIAIAEVLPECKQLAHLNILQNAPLIALASAKDEAAQEEACALYASLMAAVRVSNSIICIDIDAPSPDSSEIVKALAKQVVAYCLRNIERLDLKDARIGVPTEIQAGMKDIEVPDVLLHLVGHVDGSPQNHDDDEPAPDDDYIVGGTGVVKALEYCLGQGVSDLRRGSHAISGAATPVPPRPADSEAGSKKAKEMSKNLLGSARKIRTRLQPAILKEAHQGDEFALKRLVFLDNTLQSMIRRFEDEYPECRIAPVSPQMPATDFSDRASSPSASVTSLDALPASASTSLTSSYIDVPTADKDSDDEEVPTRVRLSRHNSDVSLASRALNLEEGRTHRIGQKLRRSILVTGDRESAHHSPGTTSPLPQDHEDTLSDSDLRTLHDKMMRFSMEESKHMNSDDPEVAEQSKARWEAMLGEIERNKKEIEELRTTNPKEWELFREAQLAAIANRGFRGGEENAVMD